MNNKDNNYNEELKSFVDDFSEQLLRDASSIELPESLTAKALFDRFEIDTDNDIAEEDATASITSRRIPIYRKAAFQMASCAACFMLIFFGYYKVATSFGGDITGDDIVESPQVADVSPMRACRSAPGEGTASYTDLREELIGYQQSQMDDIMFEYDEGFDSGKVNPPTAGGGVQDKVGNGILTRPETSVSPSESNVYETNVQVDGIDESDIIKTDGEYLYHARFNSEDGNSLVSIVKESTLELVSEIPLKTTSSAELYLASNNLIVLAEASTPAITSQTLGEVAPRNEAAKTAKSDTSNVIVPGYGKSSFNSNTITMSVEVYDIDDPAKPVLRDSFLQNGRYISSRIKDNMLYIVTQKNASGNFADDTMLSSDVIPWTARGGQIDLIPSDNIIISPYMASTNYGVVTALNITTLSTKTSAVLGMTNEVMMSDDSLFLSSTLWDYSDKEQVKTGIVAFDVSDEKLEYRGDILVNGTIDNQFSIDEYKDILRVATTSYTNEGTKSGVYLYDRDMQLVGSVTDMAPGEKIYSVRFMGDTGYVVTFKETDPLFVIDLSNPSKPVIKGELKIPGFSEYLHPIGDGLMIGLGKHTKLNTHGGVVTDGIKISMFDVSNPSDPKELYNTIIGNGNSYSSALDNHKAFMYYPEEKLFGIPASVNSYGKFGGATSENNFDGYLLFEIGKDEFLLKGSISSQEGVDNLWRYEDRYKIDRMVYVGDRLTTVSNGRLQRYSLESLKKQMEIKY